MKFGIILTLILMSLPITAFSAEFNEIKDLCAWARDYHKIRKLRKGDEIIERHVVSTNTLWVTYSGNTSCKLEYAKSVRNCEKIIVKGSEADCVSGNDIFRLPHGPVYNPARGIASVETKPRPSKKPSEISKPCL